ncbi:MAG: hypothetical protein U1C56_01195 [Candidatus Curtissbacteria bacterium]|nr:hypothetical protein [bacterium]MDZ4209776.1 hypothetical protein [Candidatus Curtissbacteria bacterium]
MYYRAGTIIRNSLPVSKKPRLTAAQIEKLKTAGEVALGLLAAGGMLTLTVMAPNTFWAFERLFFKKPRYKHWTPGRKREKVARTFYYLKQHGLIKMAPTKKDFLISLTKLGRKRLEKMDFDAMAIKRPASWDGRWWQVAADIPTKDHKRAADLFRKKLKDIGFFPLQRTLWFYPYDPRGELEFLMNHFHIEHFVTIMEISRLDKDDEKMMKRFFKKKNII